MIIVTGHQSVETADEAMRNGAYHYISKPVKLAEIRLLAKNAGDKISMHLENLRLRNALRKDSGLSSIVGNSPAIQELFGHERGAYTGATASKIGLLESAEGGTVFLDEIGEIPLTMQVKLLHVIQDRKIFRVGGIKPIDLDIRIIAATNKDLKYEVSQGTFREDLFFRLNVVSISLPDLSERREDIPLLIRHFSEKYSLAFHKEISGINQRALQVLLSYSYPGNIRELENIIERAVALTEQVEIGLQDLPKDIQDLEFNILEGGGMLTLAEMEKRYILKTLQSTGYNKGLTAQILGIPRTTLWRKTKMYGLD